MSVFVFTSMIDYYVALSSRQVVAKQQLNEIVESLRPTLTGLLWELNQKALDGMVETISYRSDVKVSTLTARGVNITHPPGVEISKANCSEILEYDFSADAPNGRPLGSGALSVCLNPPPISTADLLAIGETMIWKLAGIVLVSFILLLIVRQQIIHRIEKLIRLLRTDSDIVAHLADTEKDSERWDEIDILEHELKERTRRMLAARDKLNHAHKMQALGILTGSVAHEFNNLLAVICGNIELAENKNTDGNISRFLHRAGTSAHDASKVVDQLLAYSREHEYKKQAMNPRELSQLIDDRTDPFKRAGVKIYTEIKITSDVYFDQNVLIQAIVNLVKNAIEAIPEGTIGKIDVVVREANQDELERFQQPVEFPVIAVEVIDNGRGVPLNLRNRLFEPFFSTKRQGRGVGLGLWTVYNFAESAGGYVSYSPLSQGSMFSLILPSIEPDSFVPPIQKVENARLVYQAKKILLVDDEPALLKVFEEYFESLGAEVQSTDGVSGAYKLLEKSGLPDCIICDLALNDGSGMDIINKVKQLNPTILCVLISGNLDELDPDTANVDIVVRKPVSLDWLAQEILTANTQSAVIDISM